MISQTTISQILDAARIEEIVGDFVQLKRRGANYIACCPFHNENTPSFYVSPVKGIYKCFGCSAAGNAVNFIMNHEKLNYPDALKYLARKYHIEIQEITDDKDLAEKKQLDSLQLLMQFAAQYFENNLHHSEEGKNIALAYFKERGFTEETMRKFGLGYAFLTFDGLLSTAKKAGYNLNALQKAGLITEKEGKYFDFFRQRVIFPIHNLSGKIVAFAGRTMSSDKKTPKYINSPETEIYHKSNILYGLHHARKSIQQQNLCFLVEGYADVLSMHQAGIENTVASSGTSLTPNQVRLIKRYTSNITVLYDGDSAGIKATLRGIDIILEEGLNVHVAILPENEDPDSYVQKHGKTTMQNYLNEHTSDFIFFKANQLLKNTQNDPIKRSAAAHEIMQTLAKIADPIKRSLYIKECAILFEISEKIIIAETNKLKLTKLKKITDNVAKEQQIQNTEIVPDVPESIDKDLKVELSETRPVFFNKASNLEREIIRVLLEYGNNELEINLPVAVCLLHELGSFNFENNQYQEIINEYKQNLNNGQLLDSDFFVSSPNPDTSKIAANLLSSPYELSKNWETMHEIFITNAVLNFKHEVLYLINHYKLYQVTKLLDEVAVDLKAAKTDENIDNELQKYKQLKTLQTQLSELTGTVIVR